MTAGTRSTFQNAIDKAAALGTYKTVRQAGCGRYLVPGSRGVVYTVLVSLDGEYSCSCQAGQHDHPCYHQAATWLRRLGEQAAGRPAPRRESDADVRVRLLAESRMVGRRIGAEWDRPSREAWL
jgi:uncharacterized Zn finger protein